jgi:Mn2+/Fe2+ NRAMP family transporter
MSFNPFKNIGPGVIVAAAFIGPGTVTLCSIAGVSFGYALLWAVLLSTLATMVLQEMAARIGLITQKGLAELLRRQLANSIWQQPALWLIILAIVLGNIAYQAGNIGGGVLGLEAILGPLTFEVFGLRVNFAALTLGLGAFIVLSQNSDKRLTKVLTVLVLFMSLSFVITALIIQPDFSDLLAGLVQPTIPDKSVWTIIGLIGTTIVPYNIFLHASLVHKKWHAIDALPQLRRDTYWTIGLGGIVSMSIVICAAGSGITQINNAVDLAQGLHPLYGSMATILMGVGLFAAGMTSAITAPLAAAYVASGCLGWSTDLNNKRFKIVWRVVLLVGVVLATLQIKPITLIQVAQVANGTLIFIIVALVLWLINQQTLMKKAKNTPLQNILGVLVFVITLVVGLKGISGVLQILN